jgi:hypothetical protein
MLRQSQSSTAVSIYESMSDDLIIDVFIAALIHRGNLGALEHRSEHLFIGHPASSELLRHRTPSDVCAFGRSMRRAEDSRELFRLREERTEFNCRAMNLRVE